MRQGFGRRIGLCGTTLALAGILAGCGGERKPVIARPPAIPSTPATPERPWTPPAPAEAAAPDQPAVPAPQPPPGGRWDLAALVDTALRLNPLTRQAWAQARAAAAAMGSTESAYYPDIELLGTTSLSRGSVVSGGGGSHTFVLGGAVSLSYLLYDAGGRDALTEEARQTVLAANYSHHAVLQEVVLAVQSAFYLLQEARVLVTAEEAAEREARAALEAAEERHRAGVATIADVLQARARLSQAQLNLQTVSGEVNNGRGRLAAAVGLPADTVLEVVDPAAVPPLTEARATVTELMAEAVARRPDLAALEAETRRAEARIRVAHSAERPTVSATGAYGPVYNEARDGLSNNYALGLTLRFPLFTGYATKYDRLRAEAEAEAALERRRVLQQRIGLEVWTSFHDLQTAGQRLRTTGDLLDSAQQSYEVALGRYKAGVGIILDLLSAQATLENARAERIRAAADWYLAAARLAYATGSLGDGAPGDPAPKSE